MSTKIPWEITDAFKKLRDAAQLLENNFVSLNETANVNTGVVLPVKELTGMRAVRSVDRYRRDSDWGYLYNDRSRSETVERAKNHADECFAIDQAIHLENEKAIKNNKTFYESIERIMTNAGIPKTYQTSKPNRNKVVFISHFSGWYEDLIRCCKTDDGFSASQAAYSRQMKLIEEWDKTEQEKENKAIKEAEAAETKKVSERELAVYIVKYNLPTMSDWRDVLKAVMKKDKYLRLAYYLEMNRGDWSEGCNYAQRGLEDFSVETKEDEEIFKNVSALCFDWQGDGRVFRDCEYNYDFLYSKVSKELIEEFDLVRKYV